MAVSVATENNSEGRGRVRELSGRLKGFYTDVRSEMKKVTAPGWKEVRGTTVVVLVTVAIFGAFFYVVDMFLTWAMNGIIVHFSR
jgi:preprotein translocase SecE subunit